MDLVDDIDFVAACLGRDAHLAHQLANIVHTVVRGGIELEDVHRASLGKAAAALALAAGLGVGGEVGAVDGLGQNTGAGGLAHTAGTAEEKRLRQLPCADGILERSGDMLLPDNAVERGRTVFTR